MPTNRENLTQLIDKLIEANSRIYSLIERLLEMDADEDAELEKAREELIAIRAEIASYDQSIIDKLTPSLEKANEVLAKVLAATAPEEEVEIPDPLPPLEPSPEENTPPESDPTTPPQMPENPPVVNPDIPA